jgi:SpoVK/Ycf46/Vps4 family AAA+-type ATPase
VEPRFKFADIGGLNSQKAELAELLELPLVYAHLFESAGASPIRGLLLHGPSGCGKSILAEAAAGEFADRGLSFFKAAGPSLLAPAKGSVGQSEGKVRTLFKAACEVAPAIIVIDDIDVLSQRKEPSSVRLVSQLGQCLDESASNVFVIATTSKLDQIDLSLRRPGRLSREVSVGIPDYEQRLAVLEVVASRLNLADDVSLDEVAHNAEGFVGADLASLAQEAALAAVKRAIVDQIDVATVRNDDLLNSVDRVQPTLRREGFTTLPPASLADIGGLEDVKAELQLAVVGAVARPEIFEMYGHKPGAGVLLYGPPGCGKTLLARALAHEANRAAFISVKGPELLNKYLGESESAVRAVFRRARDSAPCIIFFDEIDALCPRRSEDSSNAAASRVVNQLLTEMDGVVDRGRVFVIGATNRMELIDEAMLRPGRLDKKIEVPLPTEDGRRDILEKHVARIRIKEEIDCAAIAREYHNASGAELEALTSEAIEAAIHESSDGNWVPVGQRHFDLAMRKVTGR